MRNRVIRLVREPLLQFLVIGACIYGAYALYGTPAETIDDRTVRVDANRIAAFVGEWEMRWSRPPTRDELNRVTDSYVREDILYRQAVAIGLAEDDPITRRRVAQKLEFLTSDIALSKQPEPGELERYFADNLNLFRQPDQITFSHAFLDPDRRGDATLGDADLLLAHLQAAGEPDPAIPPAGDRFMQQAHYPLATEQEVRRQMGSGFAATVMRLAPGQWHGPVLSGFGVHLVYVHDLRQTPAPDFAEVSDTVRKAWTVEQQEQFNEDFFASLKSTYNIEISAIPEDRILDGETNAATESVADSSL